MKKHLIIILLQLASAGNDAFQTHRLASLPFYREYDPLARPFVRSTPKLVGYFSVTTGLKLTLPPLLRKHGHPKLAGIGEWGGIGDNAVGGIYTGSHLGLKIDPKK